MSEEGNSGTDERCAWCSAPNDPSRTHCINCGAALAQRESIGEIVIPGVTSVDPQFAPRGTVLQGVMRAQGAATRAGMTAHPILPGGGMFGAVADAVMLGPLAAEGVKAGLDLLGAPSGDISGVGQAPEAALIAAAQLDAADKARAVSGDTTEESETAEGTKGDRGPNRAGGW